ncbi:MAG: hypothetical protein ABIP02_04625 [Arenimonas sp.]
MNSVIEPISSASLADQRLLMRRKIREQRAVIQGQLAPMQPISSTYPRSKIMRFFVQRPGLAVKLLTQVAGVFVGASFIKSMTTAFGFAKHFR